MQLHYNASNASSSSRHQATMSHQQLQTAINSADVVVFSASWCGYCRRALAALKEAGLRPKVLDIDTIPSSLRSSLRETVGKTSVPQIFVKGSHIGGCNDGGMGGVLPSLRNGTVQRLMAKA